TRGDDRPARRRESRRANATKRDRGAIHGPRLARSARPAPANRAQQSKRTTACVTWRSPCVLRTVPEVLCRVAAASWGERRGGTDLRRGGIRPTVVAEQSLAVVG